MEREREQPFAGQQSAQYHPHVASSALQPRADNTSDTLTLAETPRYFYEDEWVWYRAQQWSLDPSAFFRDWLSQGCVACLIYRRIQALSSQKRKPSRPKRSRHTIPKLPEEETPISTIELRICLVFFHLLRTRFQDLFYFKHRIDPLAVYLSTHWLGERADLSKNFTKFNTSGGRYYELTTSTGHPGVLLLSTTFSCEILEKTGDLGPVLDAANEEIPRVGAMPTYDNAVNEIFSIFKACLEKWIGSMAQNPHSQTSVEQLIDLRAQSSNNQNLPCPTPFDIQLVTAPETSTVEETSAVPETFPAFPQTATVAVCVDGIMRSFPSSIVLWIPDTSGVMTRVCVGALADGSNIPVLAAPHLIAAPPLNYPPSSEATNNHVLSPTEWSGFMV
ncbi:hypothetical protein CEP54_015284 [Fusarium duplospermum]|uniref:Uncharacterized protein n=1 Tax=Fusarium duplospermum TaxID=1325734 RepID=A0A428NQD4_9HYPO|nr:hypothetical protein CEP54_015284 [Fusarium duplospermum]